MNMLIKLHVCDCTWTLGDPAVQLIADNERRAQRIDTRGRTKYIRVLRLVRTKIYCVLITLRSPALSDCIPANALYIRAAPVYWDKSP